MNYKQGENHPRAKLKASDIPVIRQECEKGRGSIARMARRYGVDKETIARIRDGITWQSVPE